MKRKRGRPRKSVAKKPAPKNSTSVSADQEVFLDCGRPKKSVAKKTAPKNHTPVSADEEAFLDFVGQNVGENSVSNEINNNGFVQFNTQMEFSYSSSSSSSSSSENEEYFRLGADGSDSDDEPAVKRVMKSAKKRARPNKREASSKAANAPVMSSKGLGSTVGSSRRMSSMTRKEFPVPKKSIQDPRYNKKELKASLAVIKKVMEMDEAIPFNTPVDPVAQGLPDYFRVINTPMDFGTICSNLESGSKYMNSDDVYKDVQYIWENCCKYNKKGDYIVYLLKRVKKKFMNYWTAAGLCTEMLRKHSGHSHFAPSRDQAVRQTRHEAISVVNHVVNNSNQMQHDTFGVSQHQPQVHLSSYTQPYLSHQPQPSTGSVPHFSELQANVNSNYAGHPQMPRPQHPVPHMMSHPTHSQQQRPQSNSRYMRQSQQNTSQPQASQSHFSTDINNTGHLQSLTPMDCVMAHNGCVARSSMDPIYSSMGQPQLQHHLPSHCQQNESHQPAASMGQPLPSHPLASVDISGAGMPQVDASRKKGRHMQRHFAGPGTEVQMESQNSPPQPPSVSHNYPARSELSSRKRARGPTQCRFKQNISDSERLVVPINNLGQPVGPEACKLASFLGTVARDGKVAPLSFLDWHSMPEAAKENMWQSVQTKFDIDPLCKRWVLKSLATKWRSWKAKLKADHYTPHATDEERLKDCNKRVLPDQWAALIAHWNSEKAQLHAAQYKANRAKYKSSHVAGSKSFARLREEERAKRADGKEPTRSELYILTRTRKDGQPVDETAAEVIKKLREQENGEQQTSDGSNDRADTYCQVMGEERNSNVRMYGLGVTPTDLFGQKPSCSSIMRIAWEAKRSAKEEVGKMLNKMEAMEQKYLSLEAHIVNITSNMQNLVDKIDTLRAKQGPNIAPEDPLQAQRLRSSSSHAAEGQNQEA